MEMLAGRNSRIAWTAAAAAIAGVILSFVFVLSGQGAVGILSGFGIFIFSLVFAAIALRQDFVAWQIRERRFGSLKDYLEGKFG